MKIKLNHNFSSVIRLQIVFLLIGLLALSNNVFAQESSPPNIVFFLADDQGWNHHSVAMFEDESNANSAQFQTPNIERLANSGMRFSNAYSAAPMCNHSRRSLHVGQSAAQVLFSGKSAQEQEQALTIGEMMQNAGYQTAHFGKWSPGPSPAGLDFYHVSDGSLNNGAGNNDEPGDPKQIFSMTDRAIDFIETSVGSDQPFYVQISHFAPHTAAHALDETIQKWQGRELSDNASPGLSAMTEDLDTGIGEILDTLETLGVADNTYIFYTSDHGQTTDLMDHTPLKLGKGTLWEGGIRVPFIVSGPGIEEGSISGERVVSLDLFPTFANLANVNQPLPKELEGGDLLPTLHNPESAVERPREELVFHFPSGSGQDDFRPMSVIYLGDYKLVQLYDTGDVMLFNIKEDLAESNNLADELTDKNEEMHNLLVSYMDDMGVIVFEPETSGNGGMGMGGMGGMGMAQ